ncbi:hypothetical protein ACWEOH_02425 [Agromyces sp. NPDC004153]
MSPLKGHHPARPGVQDPAKRETVLLRLEAQAQRVHERIVTRRKREAAKRRRELD